MSFPVHAWLLVTGPRSWRIVSDGRNVVQGRRNETLQGLTTRWMRKYGEPTDVIEHTEPITPVQAAAAISELGQRVRSAEMYEGTCLQ